ncbi:Noc2-domain-containing protein [Xylona heveae TC161]|uniref:Noc2-domain-containing protein n=1 Tax=Xylona heveae (strain CBS 132557 / TC161) TaxID=1328760 RepID=A0A165GC56_XYLHT|nr:Noc2-domain-containing protein [Xylona heveae TC161]KZF22014.1 Noc2-domain-containing protein [Xylona heveae TC161]
MAKSSKKSQRKFEKNHLKDTIERRKEFAKIKQRNQQKDKKKARNEKERSANATEETSVAPTAANDKGKENPFGEMSVDDFFQGGFDIPEAPKKNGAKSKLPSKSTGKRKRSSPADSDDESAADSVEENPVADDSDNSAEEDNVFSMHKQELEALAEKDPEFYKYLKENDAELLDFGENGDLAEVDQLSGSEDDEGPKKKRKKAEAEDAEDAQDASEVTMAMVKKWTAALTTQRSLRAMRQVVLAFRAAAHSDEEDGKQYKYSISNPDVYHELLVLTLKHVPEVLNHHLPAKESSSGKIRVSTDSKKFRTLTPLLKSHTTSLLHLLSHLSDAATIKLTLSSLMPLLPYILSFRKLLREIIKSVVEIWSDSSSTEATRISAFLIVRRLTVIGDAGLREAVLKTVYRGLVQGCRNTTIHSMPGINLMKNSAAELWGIDEQVGYTTGFTFIRQLAIHLRGSITHTTKESYKAIYNWQYVHSLDFWSRVLSSHCESLHEAQTGKESLLRPLIYPTVQITLGAMRLIPTAQYFPLRFQLTRSLLRVSRATGTYIPLSASLLEVLNSSEMNKPPKASTTKALDFSMNIRAPKSYLRTRVYQDGIGEQLAELLSEFFVLWCKNIAFPELSLPATVLLRRWLKTASSKAGKGPGKRGRPSGKGGAGIKNSKVTSAIVLVLHKIEDNARWVEERRARVDFAPSDRAAVDAFLKDVEWEKTPLGAFVVGQRKAREKRDRLLEEGRREDERKKNDEREERKREMAVEDEQDGFSGSDDDASSDEEEGEHEMEEEDEDEIEDEDEDEIEMEDE